MDQSTISRCIYRHLKYIGCSAEMIQKVMSRIAGREQEFDWLAACKDQSMIMESIGDR